MAQARDPDWYRDGDVPDTLDGRFDMVAAILSFVLMRLERDDDAALLSAQVTERFVDDMDAQVRQIGFGDMVVGKHIGRMVAMLGGRLSAYRDGIAGGVLDAALRRNLYRDATPADAAVAWSRDRLIAFDATLAALPVSALAQGQLA